MIAREQIDAAARQLLTERQAGANRTPLAISAGGSIADAYRVQEALIDLLQAEQGAIAGYKIALTSAPMQQLCGVDHPLSGAILASLVYHSPARIRASSFVKLGVEFEVAVQLATDLPALDQPYTAQSVRSAVAACIPAYELVEDRNADYDRLDAFNLVADNAWNAGVVLGAVVSDWQSLDLVNAVTRLWINDEPGGEGRVGDAMGHPLAALAWLANQLIDRGQFLRAGMLVMTGSSITTKFPQPGDRLRFEIDGMGVTELELC